MKENQKFAERLKEIRKHQCLTQNQFCEKIGVTQATLSSYENGAKIPNINTIITIAKACNVSLDWLLGHSENQTAEIRTVPDILRFLNKLDQSIPCMITVDAETTVLSIKNEALSNFITEWLKMKSLLKHHDIDQEVYDFWFAKTLKRTETSVSELNGR